MLPSQQVPPTNLPERKKKSRRKRAVETHPDDGASPAAKAPRIIANADMGNNGRPIVLRATYFVNVQRLKEYAATPQAKKTPASTKAKNFRSKLSQREVIERFLEKVVQDSRGGGSCTVNYTLCEIGQSLVDTGLLQSSRPYPDDAAPGKRWPVCATQLGKKLRALALGSYYVEMDDANAFHLLLQARTSSLEAKQLISRIIDDSAFKESLSQHYFETPSRIDAIKQLLHSMSNGGTTHRWRVEHGVRLSVPDHDFALDLQRAMEAVTQELALQGPGPAAEQLIAEHFPTKQEQVRDREDPTRFRTIERPRDPKKTWKSFLLQQDEAQGLSAKLEVAEQCGIVAQSCDEAAVAAAMSRAIEDRLHVGVIARAKTIEADMQTFAFQLDFDPTEFYEKDFVGNEHLETQEAVDLSLSEYARWLRRLFVCILKRKEPMIAKIEYFPDSDSIRDVHCRNPKATKETYPDMDITTHIQTLPPRKEGGKEREVRHTLKLMEWYLRKSPWRRTANAGGCRSSSP